MTIKVIQNPEADITEMWLEENLDGSVSLMGQKGRGMDPQTILMIHPKKGLILTYGDELHDLDIPRDVGGLIKICGGERQ